MPKDRYERVHQFLARTNFYALALCTVMGVGFLEARKHVAHSGQYDFLLWNLFLAWVPYGLSLGLIGLCRTRPVPHKTIWIVGALWLIFFPNAPYILTDFIHFRTDRSPFMWWYDLGIFIAFAWTGCFLGVTSLRIVQSLIRPVVGAFWSWVCVLLAIGLSGVGVWIGRIGRLNSWDLMTDPQAIVARSYHWYEFGHHRIFLGISVMFASILLVCYVTVVMGQGDPVRGNDE